MTISDEHEARFRECSAGVPPSDYEPERNDRFFVALWFARTYAAQAGDKETFAAIDDMIQQRGCEDIDGDGSLTSLISVIIDG